MKTALVVLTLFTVFNLCWFGVVTKNIDIVERWSPDFREKRKYRRTMVRVCFVAIYVSHRPY